MPTKRIVNDYGLLYTLDPLTDRWEPLTGFKMWPEFYDFIRPGYRIKKVIFNEPATIVFWEDGTKTVVKCGPNDDFDPEKGIAMCFVKKIYSNRGRYNNAFKPWVEQYYNERVGTVREFFRNLLGGNDGK